MNQQKDKTRLLSIGMLLVISVSLITSLFFKEKWLWMDEVLSYLLISDPSIVHMNDALVSSMDQNPPIFPNVYWVIGHLVSENPQFLRAVTVVTFAITIVLLYQYTTKLIGNSVLNFVLIATIVAFTYLNLSLSTQIRGYALFLLVSLGYFVIMHRLMASPNRVSLLVAFGLLALLMVFSHSFGLFYAAASGAFFAGLFLLSRDRRYLLVLAVHALILVTWLLVWYPNFVIQTQAGKPHSWIPLPTFWSFFTIVGELAPSISSTLERKSVFQILPILRFLVLIGLWVYIALPRLTSHKFRELLRDQAFTFYLLSGFMYLLPMAISVGVSLFYRSVFISRYLWPGHLLVIYQLVYAFYFFRSRWSIRPNRLVLITRLLPLYMLLLAGFIFYQNRKLTAFPSGVLAYLPQLDKRYPVFVETADYFLPIWFHDKTTKIRYLLDWETAMNKSNILQATVEHKVLKSVREKYHVTNIMTGQEFNPVTVPHFYVIDESSNYQIEHFIENGKVQIIRELPIDIAGHRILECRFRS
ncbi:hypothetical protein [Spirosoma radiotolerans]|uniref:Glycosyltransferase RgtA/B/C/D-like domain-containing protein n=1 Tax=Spirosoma radiotolerans TaxID=1379870 RepID=A0A0E3V6A9_9BACT|nr:hypothetical protein [Spirosoma radiotolerans]AKD54371.1 hypothetical protein SD10_05040 [Spirosoma radiotolerans]